MYTTTVYTTAIPTVDNRPLDGTAQAIALERYATQSVVEVNAIQTHQANATALAANYQATSNAALGEPGTAAPGGRPTGHRRRRAGSGGG